MRGTILGGYRRCRIGREQVLGCRPDIRMCYGCGGCADTALPCGGCIVVVWLLRAWRRGCNGVVRSGKVLVKSLHGVVMPQQERSRREDNDCRGCGRRAAYPQWNDPMRRVGNVVRVGRSLEAMAYLFPEAIGGFGLEVGQTVVYILQPIFPTGCMRLLFHRDAAFAVL